MRYSLLLLVLAFSLVLPACAQKSGTRKTKKTTQTATPKEAAPILTFQRTVCYGFCPAYTASIFADGRVAYEGQAHVPVTGKKEFKLPAATIATLRQQAQAAHFEQLKEVYTNGATDIPSTIVGWQMPSGQLKTVTVEDGAPDELAALIAYLRSQLDPLAGLAAGK